MNEDNINNIRDTAENNLQVIAIKSYQIVDNDDDTYSVTIKTDVHTLSYPRTRITFCASEAVVFPVRIQVLNNSDGVILDYGLNLAASGSNEGTEQGVSEPEE